MPGLEDEVGRLVAIPSVSAPAYPESTRSPLLEAYEAVAELFSDVGMLSAERL